MLQKKLLLQLLFLALAVLSFSPLISPPIALLFGILFVNIFGKVLETDTFVKKLLQYSIVGLGFGINLNTAIEAGSQGFLFTVSTIALVMIFGLFLAKILKIDKTIAQLISAGTAICGGSAIAAVAPILKANSKQTSVALGIVFVLNAVALFIFPEIGHFFNLSQNQFGIWSAIAIHDTSSVVGAASKYGNEALQIATTVKLARALWIIPLAFLISIFTKSEGKIKIPYFIGFFVLAILAGTYLPFLQNFNSIISEISRDTLKVALFLIGAGLSLQNLKNIGVKPLLLGIILWIFISSISLYAVLEFLK
ncbi:putative sulfate exporter family transporter [Cloacibacterium normanense]|uniref:Putative sulfate exporter family transporter n=1 Tax=Cloacibacterium normanense TaxID=237258 RepID=A0A2S7I442_9FLAO|nr:putative sulfate exporter family transporter [Cloacibacterium normanense]PPZ91255.1 putative sulfate exporter family transporter [Cloacibacterium normanense]